VTVVPVLRPVRSRVVPAGTEIASITMEVQDFLEAMAEAALVKVQAVAALAVEDALVVVDAAFVVVVVLAVFLVVAVAGRAVMLEAKAAARAA